MRKAPAIGQDDIVTVPAHVRFRRIDDELVIVDLAEGEYFALNAVGRQVWQALEAGRTPAQIAESIGGEYQITPATVLDDCLTLVNELLSRGLMTRGAR